MLALHPRINPAVFTQAELFTDGRISDEVLRSVASMRGLPLLIEPGAAPTLAEIAAKAERELVGAMSNLLVCRSLFVAACRRIGMANKRPAAERRAAQAAAMRGMNKARAELIRAERREAAARAALASLAN
ncbi:hypothetical protein [Roseomonas chloroacetimidivorans]|uniref:hypothetical protein n=1 Tax=Roseomonas chloroacetimidivorans TaxID=1766656 RepID=UPI003C75A1C8